MKMILIIFLLFCESQAQENQESFAIDKFFLTVSDSKLTVENKDNQKIYERSFSNPEAYSVDLDNDGVNEFLINDFNEKNNQYFYTMYVYSLVDSFYLVDSIYSGLTEPYYTFSDEAQGYVIITGSPDFDEFSSPQAEETFSPIVCWNYADQALSINDQLYDIYLQENETILAYIMSVYEKDGKSCENTKTLKGAIAAVYANYYHAGEKSNAESFLENYYLCDDIKDFKNKIKELL